ncbi:MAG: homoserine O-succinyltransferase, partial [Xanthomonadales bacterium]|nr:homoserine O-succinyltransferase [Xanthomonadales bacterium]
LNMMPDAALTATEYQFINLVGNCNKIAQFFVYPFSLPELNRGAEAEQHIAHHYFDFDELREKGLDALIITGANVANPRLEEEAFWSPLIEVVEWADEHVASVLCSCLATHALLQHHHGIRRRLMPEKKWGVYRHRVRAPDHPLVRDINTRFDAPHSRWNDVSRQQIEAQGLRVLAESEEAGVHLAVSRDGFRKVYFQGHPEYEAHSLLKEYKREVNRFLDGELDAPPPYPQHYFEPRAISTAQNFIEESRQARRSAEPVSEFPEQALHSLVDNTWGDTGKAIVNNWLGLVYRLSNNDPHGQFRPGVDPDDPLASGGKGSETRGG